MLNCGLNKRWHFNGRSIYIKDNNSDFSIEFVLWDNFDGYINGNDELKNYLEQSGYYTDLHNIYTFISRSATDNIFQGDLVRFYGTLYVSDDKISGNWNLVTRQDYRFKENEKIIVVGPNLTRLEEQDTPEEIKQTKGSKFGKFLGWCIQPFKWFMNIINWIQGFEWIQKILNWFSKSSGN